MKEKTPQQYDLSKRRPKVLLFGNGILLPQTAKDWTTILCELAGKSPKEYGQIPYPTLSDFLLETNDAVRHNDYKSYFFDNPQKTSLSSNEKSYLYHNHPLLQALLELDFDAFLTTNYTYEAENILHPDFHMLSQGRIRNILSRTNTKSAQALQLHVCSEFRTSNGSQKEIWHIHGEARNKSQLIMTHDEYGRHVNRIIDYCKKRKNEYEKFYNEVKIKSWIDLFLVSDLYIIGFGFDFSEIDLWWLLNRRFRERSGCGKVVFFEPLHKNGKLSDRAKLLDKCPATTVKNCDIALCDNENENAVLYNKFYKKAIDELRKELKGEIEL